MICLRTRDAVVGEAGSNRSVEQLNLEVLLDIRDLLQEYVAQGKAVSSSASAVVEANPKKESLKDRIEKDFKRTSKV